MLDIIEQNFNKGIGLFFYQANRNNIINIYNLDKFVLTTSYLVTWISNFGCWKKDFGNLQNIDKVIKLKLLQVDWSLQIVSQHSISIIYFDDFFISQPILKTKSQYNLFEVFGKNYLSIYKPYLNLINKETLQIEKKKLLFKFLLPYYVQSFIHKDYFLITDKMFYYLNDYKKDIFFYFGLLLLPLIAFYSALKFVLRGVKKVIC